MQELHSDTSDSILPAPPPCVPSLPLYIGVMINFCASVLIYTATLQGFSDSWLQKVDSVDAALALDREVYVAALYFATVGTWGGAGQSPKCH